MPGALTRAPIAFRVASDPAVGLGHVSRCRSMLALLGDGVDVAWYIDPQTDGALVRSLEREHPGLKLVREDTAAGLDRLTADAQDGRFALAIIDGYRFPEGDIAALADCLDCIVLHDGQAKCASHAATLRLGLRAPGEGGVVFPIVAAPFLSRGSARRPSCSEGRPRLLLQFGARDSQDWTGRVLTALFPHRHAYAAITVILGGQARHLKRIGRRAAAGWFRLRHGLAANQIAGLYRSHDLALGAGGVALLERMACGLPGMVLSQAANQDANILAASMSKAVLLGQAHSALKLRLDLRRLHALWHQKGRRQNMVLRARMMVRPAYSRELRTWLRAWVRKGTEA